MDTFRERYEKLNQKQRQAVDSIEGPVLVVAGPGSGKTEILALRVANILDRTDAAPANILCLTFTDAAALNMRQRLQGLIGDDAYKVAIKTFHSFGVDIIDRYPEYFNEGARFSAIDDITRLEVLETIFRSLPHADPLRSELPGSGYVYLKDAVTAIADLKKAGLDPDGLGAIIRQVEEDVAIFEDAIDTVFSARTSMAAVDKADDLARTLITEGGAGVHPRFSGWARAVGTSLARAVQDSRECGKATPLSAWKTAHTEKRVDGVRVHKDVRMLPKLRSLCRLYTAYRTALRSRELFDFEDMLLDTIIALESYPELLADVQEEYQYVLVDEFQDTNDAQMRILELIGDASVNEGRPNIMAVGDDDQAIYRFQGALVSNIVDFTRRYRDVRIVTMTENYRSTQAILDTAEQVIIHGSDRLVSLLDGIDKHLVACGSKSETGTIKHVQAQTAIEEYVTLGREIRKTIDTGVDPGDIAVIARAHRSLEALVPYLAAQAIPVAYERQSSVLDQPHIRQLITMASFVASLAAKRHDDADDLLPEILSYPCFAIPRITLWQLAADAAPRGGVRKRWLGLMRNHTDRRIRDAASFFDACAGLARSAPLEQVLDALVGAPVVLHPDSENDDEALPDEPRGPYPATPKSPFREYYFSRDQFLTDRVQYLQFLSGLRVLINALRSFRPEALLTIDDLLTFVSLHRDNHLPLYDRSPFVSAQHAVQLMTAHKAKGLEFDTVFVMRALDQEWVRSSGRTLIRFPHNLAIAASGDTIDDKRRLFFVTLTRAKRNLTLTSHDVDDEGRACTPLRFLGDAAEHVSRERGVDVGSENDEAIKALESWRDALVKAPYVRDEEALLKRTLENYAMSVTHLNNYLDVSTGGPRNFLESNLLRFPQPMSKAASFGDAMHRTVEWLYTTARRQGAPPELDVLLSRFDRELARKRLAPSDHEYLCAKGREHLAVYYHARVADIDLSHGIEVNFQDEGVIVCGAHITGKIDRLEFDPAHGSYRVVDLKTGKPARSWDKGLGAHEKIKMYKYARQLQFYKFLVEESKHYRERGSVTCGAIEFLQPLDNGLIQTLDYAFDPVALERTRDLIGVVYAKIRALDIPDTAHYEQTLEGVIAFEDALLSGSA